MPNYLDYLLNNGKNMDKFLEETPMSNLPSPMAWQPKPEPVVPPVPMRLPELQSIDDGGLLAGLNETVEPAEPERDLFQPSDLFRKEEVVASAPPAPAMPKNDALAQAQSNQNYMNALMMMGKGAEKIGTAIAGTKSDPNYLNEVAALAKQPIDQLQQRNEADKNALDMAKKQFEYAYAKDQDDPNSPASKMMRETVNQLMVEAGMKVKIPENISAAELKTQYPSLMNVVNARLAQNTKKEIAEATAAGKADKDKDRNEDRNFAKEQKLSDKISQIDKEIGFSNSNSSYKALKAQFEAGKFNGLADVAAIYTYIKDLDPGSVVRESETELVLGAQSPLAKYGNMFRRITKGDLMSESFRKDLLEAMGRLNEARRNQFMSKVQPRLNSVKNYNLNMENVFNEAGIDPEDIGLNIAPVNKSVEASASTVKAEAPKASKFPMTVSRINPKTGKRESATLSNEQDLAEASEMGFK